MPINMNSVSHIHGSIIFKGRINGWLANENIRLYYGNIKYCYSSERLVILKKHTKLIQKYYSLTQSNRKLLILIICFQFWRILKLKLKFKWFQYYRLLSMFWVIAYVFITQPIIKLYCNESADRFCHSCLWCIY